MEQRVAYSRSSSGMKRILPAQAEERMQCAGVGVAFRACWQAKRAESSCSCALYSALCCHAFTAEPVAKQGASIMRASRIKQRAHWLACGGAALFFIHLRITWLEVNGAGAAVQLALPG